MRNFDLDYADRDYDLFNGSAWVEYGVCEFDNLLVRVDLIYDINDFDLDIDSAGPATYVPYGERSVKYDSGKSQLVGVNAKGHIDIADVEFVNENDSPLTDEEVKVRYNLTDEEIKGIKDHAAKEAISDIEEDVANEVKDDPGRWFGREY